VKAFRNFSTSAEAAVDRFIDSRLCTNTRQLAPGVPR